MLVVVGVKVTDELGVIVAVGLAEVLGLTSGLKLSVGDAVQDAVTDGVLVGVSV